MEKATVSIGTNERYDVHIGPGLLRRTGEYLSELISASRVAVVTDDTVAGIYLPQVRESLESAGFQVLEFIFPAGERSKNLGTLSRLLEFLAESRLTRGDCVAALGGGVCGDTAGFAAGCYMRGVSFVQLPTTLLAAVDSSVGGKTAVDLAAGKNLAGLFIQPKTVICDTECLRTLHPMLISEGVAEAVKTGVLCGEELFSSLEAGFDQRIADDVIARCVSFKGSIVASDEHERGLRRCLNLGHTAGHAIELLSDYSVSHGAAVAAGLAIVARAAAKRGLCQSSCAQRIVAALKNNELPVNAPAYSAAQLASAAMADKKREGDTIGLVIPKDIGSFQFIDLPMEELAGFFADGMEGGV